MPRQPRLEVVGLPHHIVQRGVDRQAVFFDHQCYLEYLHLLSAYAGHLEVSVHGWCLMTNHVHLLLTPSVPGTLSRLMQNLNRLYVQRINARFERTGHLWAGRFNASVVGSERYLLSCMRYIELNPVRAGMVAHPQSYPWSSWHANVGTPGKLSNLGPAGRTEGHDNSAAQRYPAERCLWFTAIRPSN